MVSVLENGYAGLTGESHSNKQASSMRMWEVLLHLGRYCLGLHLPVVSKIMSCSSRCTSEPKSIVDIEGYDMMRGSF